MEKTFASDNYSGIHPEIMEAILQANRDHAPSYGNDAFSLQATQTFKEIFGSETEVFFVYNGTGANVTGLSGLTRSFEAIICSEWSHIQVDESTAPEKFTGCKLLPLPTKNGKIYPEDIESKIQRIGDQHHPQARVISISQPTEYGTVYTVEEVKALGALAKKHQMFLHMDGARIANAAVSLNASLSSFTKDAGVDVLSFGGTKNGLMVGEAVLFFHSKTCPHFPFIRKQGMQLHSKMRFIGAQFQALLTHDLWKRNAAHANAMARLMEGELKTIKGITITQKVEANGIFAKFPPQIIPTLQEKYFFYVWNEKISEVRLMCSFDTTEEEVLDFCAQVRTMTENKPEGYSTHQNH